MSNMGINANPLQLLRVARGLLLGTGGSNEECHNEMLRRASHLDGTL